MARSVHIGRHHVDVVRDPEGMALHVWTDGRHRLRMVTAHPRAFVQRFDQPGDPVTEYDNRLTRDRAALLERFIGDLRAEADDLEPEYDEMIRTELRGDS